MPHASAVLQLQFHAPVLLRECQTFRVQVDGVALFAAHGVAEYAQEIGPVHREVGKAVAGDRFGAEIEQLPRLARAPQPHFLAGRLARQRFQRLADAERVEHARAVGAQLQAGADFAQLRCLLVDVDIEALVEQRERRREAADAAAGNEDMRNAHHPDAGHLPGGPQTACAPPGRTRRATFSARQARPARTGCPGRRWRRKCRARRRSCRQPRSAARPAPASRLRGRADR